MNRLRFKKPTEHQVMVVLEWVIIINALVAAVADIVNPGTLTGWVWALCTALAGVVGLMRLDRIKKIEELAESGRRLCMAAQELRELAMKQRNIIQAQVEEIKRLKGEQHHEDQNPQ